MYFKRKEKTLDVSVEEAVRIAYACRGNVGVQEESEALPSLYPTADVRPLNGGMPKEQNESKLFCGEFPFGDISLRLFGFATPLF